MNSAKLLKILVLAIAFPVSAPAAEPDFKASWPHTDFSRRSVPLDSISIREAKRNVPPAINKPELIALQSVADLGGLEPVVTLEIGGIWRAYPLQILARHQVINDTIGDVPVVITFCPLRKSAAAFERRAEGVTLDLATAGVEHSANILLFDTQTETLWQQIDGAAVVGKMNGQKLRLVPARLESFAKFKSRVPQSQIEEAAVMAPTELTRRPLLQTDAENLIIPVSEPKAGDNKATPKDRVIVVGEDAWTLSVLQRVSPAAPKTPKPSPKSENTPKKQQHLKVYYKNGALQVPYEQEDDDQPKKKPE